VARGYGLTVKFVTLEFTAVLMAEATMPTSPVASTPAGRAPLKLSVLPTCAPVELFGSVGATCWKTRAVNVTFAPLTVTSIVKRYHEFSRTFAPSATVVNAVFVLAWLVLTLRRGTGLRIGFDASQWWVWLKEAAPLALGAALDTVYFRMDVIILSIMVSSRAAAIYNIGYKFSDLLGAVPIAFAQGAGAETRNPMGIVVVGGLMLSTLITLYVIPIVYVIMDKLCVRFTGKSSAHGLSKAAEIERETDGRAPDPAPAK